MPEIPQILRKPLQSAGIDSKTATLRGIVLTSANGSTYFARTSRDIKQVTGEMESLKALAKGGSGLVPKVYGFEIDEKAGEAAMVSQYFDLVGGRSSIDSQRELAKRVAKLHRPAPEGDDSEGKYGFHVPTHCGVTEQDNTWEEDWEVFFRDRRLGDLVRRIGDDKISAIYERLKIRAIPLLLGNIKPPPKPVILHGDLWSGNTGVDGKTGLPVIYDPSSYFGHNEADFGITRMFGGFSSDFFVEYHKVHPRSEPYYDQRQKLYELYHHLNHALMFGGGYVSSAVRLIENLIEWSENISPS